jgi:processive 1,2-diacylglycerol beta-glucosyltransferase
VLARGSVLRHSTPRRVLLASLNAGGGHHALRDSFHAVLRRLDPDHRQFEPVVWTSADRLVDRFYALCVRHLPRFQGTVVELSSQTWAIDVAMRLNPQLLSEASALLAAQRFDLLLSTHPLQSMVFARARRTLGLTAPLVCAVPDYGTPPAGYYPTRPALRPDALIVMEEGALEHYRGEGVPEKQMHLSGFLPREEFVQVGARMRSEGRGGLRAELRAIVAEAHPEFATFALDRPTLLFLGGSAWTAKTEPVLRSVLEDAALRQSINVLVVCGKDAAFEARLRVRAGDGLHVFGFVSPRVLSSLMALADAPVLGSLAPATLQELLEVGLGPLLLFHFIPGSEQPHVSYIENQRLGVYEPRPPEMVHLIRQALGLAPISARLALVRDGYRERARLLRTRSVERAYQLPRFFERLALTPIAPPRDEGAATG